MNAKALCEYDTLEKEVKNRKLVLTRPESDFEINIDDDRSLCYERRKFVYLCCLPLMWILTFWVRVKKLLWKPKINTFWFDGLSVACRNIKEGSGSWKALDIICNYKFGKEKNLKGFVSDFWIGMINAQAVRNRKKLAKRELLKAIREYAKTGKEVRILSIASGSAQALIETIEEARKEGINVTALFTDIDKTAIDYSNNLINKHGLKNICIAKKCTAISIEKITNGKKFHIIEMIGFPDYRPHLKAVRLITRLKSYLLVDGTLLTANIVPNLEMNFLREVINWDMIYRQPEELGQIVVEGGFDVMKCKIFLEPLNVHTVIISKN